MYCYFDWQYVVTQSEKFIITKLNTPNTSKKCSNCFLIPELDAAEGRQNRLSRRIRRSESASIPWSWARRQTAYARFYRHEGIMISTLFASSLRIAIIFRSLPRLGWPASSNTTAWQMAATSSVQKTELDFSEPAMLLPKNQPPEWQGIQP